MAVHFWTCQRVQGGKKCAHVNPKRKQLCEKCGGRRSPTKKRAHKHVLEVFPYKTWVIFFGERCGICGTEPKLGEKLHREHDHRTGQMRGLLCWKCNSQLPYYVTIEWMEKALAYLRRAAGHI